MAQMWRIAGTLDADTIEPSTRKRSQRSGTIRIDDVELRRAKDAMSKPPAGGERDDDTVTSCRGIVIHEPVRDSHSGEALAGGEPLCAVVTPGTASNDPLTGRRRTLLMVREASSCALVEKVRHETEELLRQDEERLRLAMDCGRMLAWELRFATGTLTLTGDAAGVLGVPHGERPLRVIMENVHPDDRAGLNGSLFHAGRDGAPLDTDVRWIRPSDKRTIWVELRGRVKVNDLDEIVSLAGLAVDVTARRRAEDVRARAAELEALRQRMEDVSRVRTQFLANMSHDLRTPLNAIIGFTELIHDGHVTPGSAEQTELTGDVLAAARKLLGFIDDLLDVAELEARTADSIGRARHPDSGRGS